MHVLCSDYATVTAPFIEEFSAAVVASSSVSRQLTRSDASASITGNEVERKRGRLQGNVGGTSSVVGRSAADFGPKLSVRKRVIGTPPGSCRPSPVRRCPHTGRQLDRRCCRSYRLRSQVLRRIVGYFRSSLIEDTNHVRW